MSIAEGIILKKQYKILQKLGEGGFSSVYLGEDTKDVSRWAIKEYNISYTDLQKNHNLLKQIHFEASILLKLSHYQLPRFKDYFFENEKHYLIMDFIDGKDLYTLINNSNKYISLIPVEPTPAPVQLTPYTPELYPSYEPPSYNPPPYSNPPQNHDIMW